MTKHKKYWNILEDCIRVAKARESTYNDVVKNLEGITDLYFKLTGKKILPSEYAMMLVATKLNRESYKHKPDNLIDSINYTAIALHLKNLGK